MNYAAVGALTVAQQQQEQAALAQLPPCYSEEFYRCYSEGEMAAYPNCKLFDQVYNMTGDDGALETAVQSLPYCPAPSGAAETGPVHLALAFVAGLGLGYVIWGVKR